MWTFMKCWTLLATTGVCCHSSCCAELSKAVTKLLSLGGLSWSLVKCTSQMYIDSLWDKTRVVSSAPLLPQTVFSMGRKLGVQVLWELQCVTFRALIGWLALQLTEQPSHSLDTASVRGLKHSAPKNFEILASSPGVCTVCSTWCLRSSQGAIKPCGWTAVGLSWTDRNT